MQEIEEKGVNPWDRKIPGVGNGNLLQYSCLERFHGQRSLVGYSPWGLKESAMTEHTHIHTHTHTPHTIPKIHMLKLYPLPISQNVTVFGDSAGNE